MATTESSLKARHRGQSRAGGDIVGDVLGKEGGVQEAHRGVAGDSQN